ncbi:unnamed protein product [Ixodes pacificus]
MKCCACVLSLLVCGDVESNPGPTDHELLIKISANVDTLLKRTNGLEEKLENLSARVTSNEDLIKAQAEESQKHVHTLEQKIDDLENRERRNNLVIYGLNKPSDENPSSLNEKVLTEIFEQKLEVTINTIERIHRLGKPRRGFQRPVILKLMDYREKQVILQNARKLKGTNISIGEDFSFRVRSIRKLLWGSSQSNREKGDKVYLSYDKLKINGEVYIWDHQKNDKVKLGQSSHPLSDTAA